MHTVDSDQNVPVKAVSSVPVTFLGYWVLLLSSVLVMSIAKIVWEKRMRASRDTSCHLPLPPGGFGVPYIGEMLEFAFKMKFGDFFRDKRMKYGNIFKTHILGRPTIRVIGCDVVRKLLHGEHSSIESSWPRAVRSLMGEKALAMLHGHTHRDLRKVVMKAFSPEALNSYVYPLSQCTKQAFAEWCKTPKVHVFEEAKKLAFRASCETLLGVQNDSNSGIEEFANDFTEYANGFFTLPLNIPGTAFYKALRAKSRIQERLLAFLFKGVMECGYSQSYALHYMMEAVQDGSKNPDAEELRDVILELLFAGLATTSSAITSLIMYLTKYADVANKLREQIMEYDVIRENDVNHQQLHKVKYLDSVIKEVLRLAPPVGGGFRTAVQTIQIGDYQIPKGWSIIYSILDSHETTQFFHKADKFCPERWQEMSNDKRAQENLLTFGSGTRMCVGRHYAQLFLKIVAVYLVTMCKCELDNPTPSMRRLPVYHPRDGMPATFTPHTQSLSDNV